MKGARMKLSTERRGFSLPELSVVMFLTVLITGVLVVFYAQSRLQLERGMALTEIQQRTRLTAIRIIPKIASVIRTPPNQNHPNPNYVLGTPALAWPLPPDDPSWDPQVDPGSPVIVLNTTKEFIQTQMRQPITDPFNPRWLGDPATDPYGLLRLKFIETGTDANGNVTGEVRMDPYSGPPIPRNRTDDPAFNDNDALIDGNPNDDLVLASNISQVSWLSEDNRRVRLRVVAKGVIKNATSGKSPMTDIYETDVYLPVYTNTSGGGGV